MCLCSLHSSSFFFFFFFNDTATTEIYTLSLHGRSSDLPRPRTAGRRSRRRRPPRRGARSEEHTSELQSPKDLVCRLLLEKKKTVNKLRRSDSLKGLFRSTRAVRVD